MIIPFGFDESNAERRQREVLTAQRTAQKLNLRLKQFLQDIDKNATIKQGQKTDIKAILLEGTK